MTPIFKGLRHMACWSPFREICGHTPQTTGGNASDIPVATPHHMDVINPGG